MKKRSDPCPGCNHPWSCHMDTPKGCDVTTDRVSRCGCKRKPPKKLTPKQRAYLIAKVRAYRAPVFDDRVEEKPAPRPITPEEEAVVNAAVKWAPWWKSLKWPSPNDQALVSRVDKLLAARAKEAKCPK